MFHNIENNPEIHQQNVQAGQEMTAYMQTLIVQRRAELQDNPQLDDTFSRLLKSTFDDAIDFTDARIITNIMGTLVGGIETTSQAIVQILEQLFKRPEMLEQAVAAANNNDDELVFKYCWEALRFNPINPFVVRRSAVDYRIASGSLRSKLIPRGRTVFVSTRSAMRDGRQLKQASAFCIDRPDYHYMHLGYGLHACLGNHISRVQVPTIVKRLLQLPDLRPTGPIDFKDGPFPESYVVEFG
jgi:cytochrome P450